MYELNVYLLDLCILSYQLHAQTLIFPFDPYYEFSKKDKRRARLMDALRVGFQKDSLIHGPGSCQGTMAEGWPTNDTLEPIFSDYSRIYPWRPSFTRPDAKNEPWILYDAPSEITAKIGKVCMVRYGQTAGPYHSKPVVEVDTIPLTAAPTSTATTKPDLLYCFEGGTGAVHGDTTQKQYPAWSMMGFVLAHQLSPVDPAYDVYIVFRGSRSGELRPRQAGWQKGGNPDWVTDLQLAGSPIKVETISVPGKCVSGFSTSLQSMLLTIKRSLEEVHNAKQKPPRSIYVTGHSLGGALASLFTSAVLLGNSYGPHAEGPNMPVTPYWPWRTMKLVTFSSPAVGNKKFQESLDTVCPGTRIYVDGDIVTTQLPNLLAVGFPFKLTIPKELRIVATAEDFVIDPHDPLAVRRSLLGWLRQKRLERELSADLDGIPMTGQDNEPWKLFSSTKSMLDAFAKGRSATELVASIPDCEKLLLIVLTNLGALYDPKYNAELNQLSAEMQRLSTGQVKPYQKLQSLGGTLRGCKHLPAGYKSLYALIGLCLYFNALSKDPNVYMDSAKLAELRYLIEEFQRI